MFSTQQPRINKAIAKNQRVGDRLAARSKYYFFVYKLPLSPLARSSSRIAWKSRCFRPIVASGPDTKDRNVDAPTRDIRVHYWSQSPRTLCVRSFPLQISFPALSVALASILWTSLLILYIVFKRESRGVATGPSPSLQWQWKRFRERAT